MKSLFDEYSLSVVQGHDLKSLSISESTNDDDLREQLQRMERKQRDHSAERKANTDEIKRLKERIDIMEKEINTLRPKNKARASLHNRIRANFPWWGTKVKCN